MAQDPTQSKGMLYAPGILGKHIFRIREQYVAQAAADMIRRRRVGALKLDLIMRGIARPPDRPGDGEPGLLPTRRGRLSYQALHDMCRSQFSVDPDTPETTEKKRAWVREQLLELEERSLVVRQQGEPGERPKIVVLRDLGDGKPFDDPSGRDGGYITVSGTVLSSQRFSRWGAPEVVAYLCAMTADRFARHRHKQLTGEDIPVGSATWFRQADWFNDTNPNFRRPSAHVSYPFSTQTIQRGLRQLASEGLILSRRTTRNPETGQKFLSGPRMVYRNRFNELDHVIHAYRGDIRASYELAPSLIAEAMRTVSVDNLQAAVRKLARVRLALVAGGYDYEQAPGGTWILLKDGDIRQPAWEIDDTGIEPFVEQTVNALHAEGTRAIQAHTR